MSNNKPLFKFIDLFAGIGGIRLGFESVATLRGLTKQLTAINSHGNLMAHSSLLLKKYHLKGYI